MASSESRVCSGVVEQFESTDGDEKSPATQKRSWCLSEELWPSSDEGVLFDIEASMIGPFQDELGGILTHTDYALRFTPRIKRGESKDYIRRAEYGVPGFGHLDPTFLVIPSSTIKKVEKVKEHNCVAMEIVCKDVRKYRFVLKADGIDRIIELVKLTAFPTKLSHMYGVRKSPSENLLAGWNVYHPETEFRRQGIFEAKCNRTEKPQWIMTDINREFKFSPTYPRMFVVPANFLMDGPGTRVMQKLDSVASFRAKRRIPALTYRHRPTGTVIFRGSQPKVGMSNNSNPEDYKLLMAVREAAATKAIAAVCSEVPSVELQHRNRETSFLQRIHNCSTMFDNKDLPVGGAETVDMNKAMRTDIGEYISKRPLVIADARPKANAMGNRAAGWGYETYPNTEVVFLNIHNIHAIRDAFRKIEAAVLNPGVAPQTGLAKSANASADTTFGSLIESSHWLIYIRTLLSASFRVAHALHRTRQSVFIHCSDGWDRTAQIAAIAQILLDPYFRTLKGFCVLVEKDWCSFGHRFRTRCGHSSDNVDDDHDVSPIFVQFMDSVYQLVVQFPAYFEYTPCFLLAMAYHLNSGKFGTLLYDSEKDRKENDIARRMRSLWEWVRKQAELDVHSLRAIKRQCDNPETLGDDWIYNVPLKTALKALDASNFISPVFDYRTAKEVLLPPPSMVLRRVRLWEEYFCRFAPQPSMPKKSNSGYDAGTIMWLHGSNPVGIAGHSEQIGIPCYSSEEDGLNIQKEKLWGFVGPVSGSQAASPDGSVDEVSVSDKDKEPLDAGASPDDSEDVKVISEDTVQHEASDVSSVPLDENGPDEEQETADDDEEVVPEVDYKDDDSEYQSD